MGKTNEEPCIHHWIIGTPKGPTSKGVCTKCHETRVFDNRKPEHYDETTRARVSAAAKIFWAKHREERDEILSRETSDLTTRIR